MMRLTTYTDYTLRTLIYLALEPERLARIAEIAKAYGISENHLMKVVHQLGVAGYVETIRGKNGGLRLAVRPEAINLGAVVRRVEPDLDLVPCFNPSGNCRIRPVCALKGVLGDALGAFFAVLDRYTLADLMAPRKESAGLLGVSSISVEMSKSSTRRMPPVSTRSRAHT
jgi:Rrf2 family transcriptional regulator, nitric oxide-sensitive transcriptional repressor